MQILALQSVVQYCIILWLHNSTPAKYP